MKTFDIQDVAGMAEALAESFRSDERPLLIRAALLTHYGHPVDTRAAWGRVIEAQQRSLPRPKDAVREIEMGMVGAVFGKAIAAFKDQGITSVDAKLMRLLRGCTADVVRRLGELDRETRLRHR